MLNSFHLYFQTVSVGGRDMDFLNSQGLFEPHGSIMPMSSKHL